MKNEFKIGDKVKLIKLDDDGYAGSDGLKINGTYTVSKADYPSIKVKEGKLQLWINNDCFELVESEDDPHVDKNDNDDFDLINQLKAEIEHLKGKVEVYEMIIKSQINSNQITFNK